MKLNKPKAAFIGDSKFINDVYGGGRREKLAFNFEFYPEVLSAENLNEKHKDLKDIQFLFSTWGMPALDEQQISLFPSLQALFYAAGSVQSFARPFLKAGILIISAWGANAIPVAEYVVARILLQNKGFIKAEDAGNSAEAWKTYNNSAIPGNFEIDVALLGAGMIGRTVIKLLRSYSFKILVFDPFLSEKEAENMNVEKVGLKEAFSRGFVISNHLADLPATKGMLIKELFMGMQPNAAFINTARGATVDEPAMIEVLRQRPDLTAILDVTYPEPPVPDSPLYSLKNVLLTPHIAGATGSHEKWRMADFIISEAQALCEGKDLQYEVTLPMLETMA